MVSLSTPSPKVDYLVMSLALFYLQLHGVKLNVHAHIALTRLYAVAFYTYTDPQEPKFENVSAKIYLTEKYWLLRETSKETYSRRCIFISKQAKVQISQEYHEICIYLK